MKYLSALIALLAGPAFASGQYLGKGQNLAYAPTELPPGVQSPGPIGGSTANGSFSWERKFQGPSWVFTDLSLGDAQNIFAAAELGKVLKSIDGGETWTVSLNQGYPYYWYGVHAFDTARAVITGFNNQTSEGLIRWTFDGGETWLPAEVLEGRGWPQRILYVDEQIGMTYDLISAGIHFTSSGGLEGSDWGFTQATPNGWVQGNFTMMPDGNIWISGIDFCHSSDYGATWEYRPSIDPIFDGGGVSFPDAAHGWVGGGSISPTVEGWVHRTADGGKSWSDRILRAPFPIRAVLFLDANVGFAVGGNIYSGVGGVYTTLDGGDTWTLDLNTGAEMRSIKAWQTSKTTFDVWTAGFTGGPSFTGSIFRAQIALPVLQPEGGRGEAR